MKKVDNTSATQKRYEVFNSLYNTVNKINKAGRKVFKDDPVNLVHFKSKWPRRGNGSSDDGSADNGSSDNGGDEPNSNE